MQNNTLILISVLVIFGLFVVSSCSIKCDNRDGFSQQDKCPNGGKYFCPPNYYGTKNPCRCIYDSCAKLNCDDNENCRCMPIDNNPDGKPNYQCWCVPKH